MVFKFNDCTIKNGGTLAKTDSDVNFEFSNCNIENLHGNAFEVTQGTNITAVSTNFSNVRGSIVQINSHSLLSMLNLPDDTNVQELIKVLRNLQNSSKEEHHQIISSSFLSNFNNLTGIANNILQALPYLPQF